MRRPAAPLVLALALAVLGLAACGGHAGNAASTAAPQASAAPSASAQAGASPGSQTSPGQAPQGSASPGTPTPEPTPTPDTNLLSWKNGTIVRSYPQAAVGAGNGAGRVAENGVTFASGQTGPAAFVYELAGPASITAFTADLPRPEPSSTPASVTFAVSANGATGDFKDAGTITATDAGGLQTLPVTATGRWIRVTVNGPSVNAFGATGTLAPLPAGVTPAGIYVELDEDPGKDGAFNGTPTDTSPWYRRVSIFGTGMTAVRCYDGHPGPTYPGDLTGRAWNFTDGTTPGRAFVNDDASLIVGSAGDSPFFLARTTVQPKWCVPSTSGSGDHRVLVLDAASVQDFWPVAGDALPGYAYERMQAGMLDPAALDGKEMAILNSLCFSSHYFGKEQADGLLEWVAAGHKLLIVDADTCDKSSYDFLPYAFTTANPGAHGASGKNLLIVESDALGSSDKNDPAHYFDPQPWIQGSNQLGDANTVTSTDPHWCGHLFGTNVLNVNGFMQMYAPYEKGTIIYDGFDEDDGDVPGYQRVRALEFALPVPNDLPCTQKVAGSFVIQPNQEGTFTAGTAQTQKFTMELLANQGWKGHVTVAASGDFQATVTPAAFDVAGGTQPLQIAVEIPATAKAGAYTVTVTGTGDGGTSAAASITFTGTAPLKKEVIKKHQRIRIYGIHFDYDSARIQPRSEPVIADIAALMRANPAWHFEVSGHTDSDGGAAYNLGLSQRRAQAVVDDLVKRYGIARSRLVAKGYGLTRPVASNATPAGKALNRRVELERLQ